MRILKISIRFVILVIAFLTVAPSAFADDGTLELDSIDVPRYIIRRWYVSPDKTAFFDRQNGPNILQGWSVLGFYNPQFGLNPSNLGRRLSPFSVAGGLQKDFDKSNAVRLSFGYSRGDVPGPASTEYLHRINRYTLSADYLWNLSNHWYGYDPARSWEWLLMIGGTWGYNKNRIAASRQFWQAEAGFQVRKTLSPRLSAFLEPYYLFADQDYDFYQNGVNLDDALGMKAGLIFRLTDPLRQTPWYTDNRYPRWNENWFLQDLLGLCYAHIPQWSADRVTLSEYAINFHVGRWFSPAWGFSTGLSDRQMMIYEVSPEIGRHASNRRQTFWRLEGILNIPSFWNEVSIGRLGLTAQGGIELGNERVYRPLKNKVEDKLYHALTAAGQAKYFLSPYTALVGEGRYSFMFIRRGVFSPSIGIEHYYSSYRRYSPWRRSASSNTRKHTYLPFLNDKNWFFEAGAGFIKPSTLFNYHWFYSPMTEMAVGFRLDSISSFRVKEHLIYQPRKQMGTPHFDNLLGLDYMFDITGLLVGSKPDRRFSARAFAGAVWQATQITPGHQLQMQNYFAGEFGLQHALRINSNAELYAEVYHLTPNHSYNRWGASAGLSYTIGHYKSFNPNRYDGKSALQGFYVQTIGSMQTAYGFGYRHSKAEGLFDLIVGHGFCNVLALQGTLFSQRYADASKNNSGSYGARVELVGDVLNMLWSDSHDAGWAWTLQAGLDAGRSTVSGYHHYGPTVATQMRRRIMNSPTWFALQARLQDFSDGAGYNAEWSVGAGLHYEVPSQDITRHGDLSRTRSPFYLQGGVAWYDASTLGYSVAMGTDINRLHGIRLGYDHAATRLKMSDGEHVRMDAVSLDYMYDVLTALYGPNEGHRVGIRPFIGGNVTMHNTHLGENGESEFKAYGGFETGLHTDWPLNKHVSLFLEQKGLYLPYDDILSPNNHKYWHWRSAGGLKIVM